MGKRKSCWTARLIGCGTRESEGERDACRNGKDSERLNRKALKRNTERKTERQLPGFRSTISSELFFSGSSMSGVALIDGWFSGKKNS